MARCVVSSTWGTINRGGDSMCGLEILLLIAWFFTPLGDVVTQALTGIKPNGELDND